MQRMKVNISMIRRHILICYKIILTLSLQMIRIAMFNALFDLIVLIVIVYLANTRMRLTEKCEAT